jgi:hypothetical protein
MAIEHARARLERTEKKIITNNTHRMKNNIQLSFISKKHDLPLSPPYQGGEKGEVNRAIFHDNL